MPTHLHLKVKHAKILEDMQGGTTTAKPNFHLSLQNSGPAFADPLDSNLARSSDTG